MMLPVFRHINQFGKCGIPSNRDSLRSYLICLTEGGAMGGIYADGAHWQPVEGLHKQVTLKPSYSTSIH